MPPTCMHTHVHMHIHAHTCTKNLSCCIAVFLIVYESIVDLLQCPHSDHMCENGMGIDQPSCFSPKGTRAHKASASAEAGNSGSWALNCILVPLPSDQLLLR